MYGTQNASRENINCVNKSNKVNSVTIKPYAFVRLERNLRYYNVKQLWSSDITIVKDFLMRMPQKTCLILLFKINVALMLIQTLHTRKTVHDFKHR